MKSIFTIITTLAACLVHSFGITGEAITNALDSTGITWQTTLSGWTVATGAEAHDGVDAVRTPAGLVSSEASIEGTVTGPGTLHGWVTVSSEKYQDVLLVKIDGATAASFSGEKSQAVSLPVPRGSHQIALVWKKDATVDEGQDAAWLDAFHFTQQSVPLLEALDLVGAPHAELVAISQSGSWLGVADADAHAAGDALFLDAADAGVVTITAEAPMLVSFYEKKCNNGVPLVVTGDELTVVLESTSVGGGWTHWQVLLPQAGAKVTVAGSTDNQHPAYLLDDFSVEPLASVPLAQALDVPLGITVTAGWSAEGIPWPVPAPTPWFGFNFTTFGPSAGGALLANAVSNNRHQMPELRFTVPGPGKLQFSKRTISGPWEVVMLDSLRGSGELVYHKFSAQPYLVDHVVWTPTPHAVPAPSAAEAADVAGNITITNIGQWTPLGFAGAGVADEDALFWNADPVLAQPALAMTVVSPVGGGWLEYSFLGSGYLEIDNTQGTFQIGDDLESRTRWQRVARWLPEGTHLLAWTSPDQDVRLDRISFSTAVPGWIMPLEGTGISAWQMEASPALSWSADAAVSHEGGSSLRTPELLAGQETKLIATAGRTGHLHFWWKSDHPPSGIPSVVKFSIPGTDFTPESSAWEEVGLDLFGFETLTWNISRPANTTAMPSAIVHLDGVSFTPDPPPTAATLAEALDTPSLNWTNSAGVTAWTRGGYAGPLGDDFVHMETPEVEGDPPAVWIETTLPGPGLVKLVMHWEDGGSEPEVLVGGVAQTTDFLDGIPLQVLGSGTHTLRIVLQGSPMDVSHIEFTPLPLVSVAEALDVSPTQLQVLAPPSFEGLGIATASASHDGVDAARYDSIVTQDGQTMGGQILRVTGPARVSFWWRGEGNGLAMYRYEGVEHLREATFAWEKQQFDITSAKTFEIVISALASDSSGYRLWLDEVNISPMTEIPVAQALQLAPEKVTTSNNGWHGYTPTGVGGTTGYVQLSSNGVAHTTFLEIEVTGPAVVNYVAKSEGYTLSLASSNGMPVSVPGYGPIVIPEGEQRIRWTFPNAPGGEFEWTLSGLTVTPNPLEASLGSHGLSFAATGTGFWYSDDRNEGDSQRYTTGKIARVSGIADLTTTVTGPGWLNFEAERSPEWVGHPSLAGAGLDVRFRAVGSGSTTTALALHAPWGYFAVPHSTEVLRHLWVPAGQQEIIFHGTQSTTLRDVSFTSQPSVTGAANLLELPAGVTMSFPSSVGGGIVAEDSHDGVDALKVVSTNTLGSPLVSFALTGPAVFSGWIQVGSSQQILQTRLNDTLVELARGPYAAQWQHFTLPITASGPQVVSLGVIPPYHDDSASWPAGIPFIELDELSLSPITATTLTAALDGSALVWNSPNGTWTGGAAASGTADGVDAAWFLVPANASSPRWLETTITGPGILHFFVWNMQQFSVSIGGGVGDIVPYLASSGYSYGAWGRRVLVIPPGAQTIRLTPASNSSAEVFGIDQVSFVPDVSSTLAEALDLPVGTMLTPTGVDAARWGGRVSAESSHDGSDAVQLRGPITQATTLEMPVTGPALVRWWEHYYPSEDWVYHERFFPAGAQTMRWEQVPDFWSPANVFLFSLDEVSVTPVTVGGTLGAVLDQPAWSFGTNLPSRIIPLASGSLSHDGVDALLFDATSTDIFNGGNTELSVTIPGPGIFSFWWRPLANPLASPLSITNVTTLWGYDVLPPGESWHRTTTVITSAGPSEVTLLNATGQLLLDEMKLEPSLPINVAAGAPELTFTYSGSWVGLPNAGNGNLPAIPQASAFLEQETAWLETSVAGPGRLTFATEDWNGRYDNSSPPQAELRVDDETMGSVANYGTLILPAGTHRVRWSIAAGAEYPHRFSVSQVHWAPSTTPDPLALALEAPTVIWLFDSSEASVWNLLPTVTPDGFNVVSRTSGMRALLSLPGTVTVRARPSGMVGGSLPPWSDQAVPFEKVISFYNDGATDLIDRVTYAPQLVTLAEAMDALAQVWETSAENPFSGYVGPHSTYRQDIVEAATTAKVAPGAWLQTTVTGPCRITFKQEGAASFLIDGTATITPYQGSPDFITRRYELANGPHTLRWEKPANAACVLDAFTLTPLGTGTSLAEVLDFAGPWVIGELNVWTATTTDSADGIDAARWNEFPGTGLKLGLVGPGKLEFSAASNWDNMATAGMPLVVSSNPALQWFGYRQPAWTQYSFAIPVGPLEIAWQLPGENVGLDQVRFTPYVSTSLVNALDNTDVIFTTNPGASCRGYVVGDEAADSQDVMIGCGDQSWVQFQLPPGEGVLSFQVRNPASPYGSSVSISTYDILSAPVGWKRHTLNITTETPHVLTIHIGNAWMDSVQFTHTGTSYATWLADFNLPATTTPHSDDDHDSISALLEYAFGLDPTQNGGTDFHAPANAGLPVFSFETISGVPCFCCRYLHRRDTPALHYEVFFTDDLGALPATPNATNPEASPVDSEWEIITTYDPAPVSGHRFGRVRVRYEP